MATFTALFGHCNEVNAKVGDKFKIGTYIKATEGKTGMADGRHIHLAVAEGKITKLDNMRLTPLNKGTTKPNKVQCERFISKELYQGGYKVTTTYLEKEYEKIYGVKHPAIDITSTSGGNPKIYWPLIEEGTVTACGKNDSGYGNYIMISYTVSDFVITPVNKDTTKDQIEVLVDDLRVRSSMDTSNDKNILGFAKKGFYDYVSSSKSGGYDWYLLTNNTYYIAYDKSWAKIHPKEETIIEPPKKDSEEIIKDLEKEIEKLKAYIEQSDNEIKQLKEALELFKGSLKEFQAKTTDKYWIKLNKDDKVYIE